MCALLLTSIVVCMVFTIARPPHHPGTQDGARPFVTVTAALIALGLLGFAAINVAYEITDRFADGPYAEYAAALAVMDWLVVSLKLLGAAVALLSVARRSRFVSPGVISLLLWAAFATFSVYALGSAAEAAGMATGLTGSASEIDIAGIAYVLGSLLFAAGYGLLAISYSRRFGMSKGSVVAGVLIAPALLGLLLLVIPALLAAIGLMPAP
jgi:hypothetical protein